MVGDQEIGLSIDTTVIPLERIESARSFHEWGSEEWRTLYDSDPREWADNEIRMMNMRERQDPNSFGDKDIVRRDVLYLWRNEYLREYNSSVGRPVDPKIERQFVEHYETAMEVAYKDKTPKELESANGKFNAFQERRRASNEYKLTGPLEEDIHADDLYGGTDQWSRS